MGNDRNSMGMGRKRGIKSTKRVSSKVKKPKGYVAYTSDETKSILFDAKVSPEILAEITEFQKTNQNPSVFIKPLKKSNRIVIGLVGLKGEDMSTYR
jgi:hypothetical protein